ncbi:MAG: M3 family metallopeptidase [Proteobacteria bacterium]|nr:M3 family metallopeptidase [Pseudomonadota bacterium]
MADPSDNPLLAPSDLPYEAIPFSKIKPEHFLPAIEAGIAETRKNIEAITSNPGAPTFENTIEALEFSGSTLSRIDTIFTVLSAATNSDAMMGIKSAINGALSDFDSDVMTDAALFARVKAVYDAKGSLVLDAEQNMLLKKTYQRFVDSGALLDAASQAELRDVDQKITELADTFVSNIVKAIGDYKKVIDNEAELAGIPERTKNIYRAAAEQNGHPGKWLIELSPPPHDIFLYSENRELRKEIHQAVNNLAYGGPHDNRQVLMDLVRQRHRHARILGYKNYAELILKDRMIKTPDGVMNFLKKMGSIYKPAAEEHLQRVKDLAKATDGLVDLEPWDYKYYNRKLQEQTFKINMEDLRPYFDIEKVFDGLRLHAEKLFNIEIKEAAGKYPVYNPDVKVYEVHDKKSGDMLGVMYTDYYARPGEKNNGSWMEAFRERGLVDGEDKCPIIINFCDFAKPAAGQPTLLSPEEVRTLFHEFGHGLHSLLGEGKYPSQNGTNVERDYMELPSQLQENWVREEEVLATFAKHYKTGEPLSSEQIKTLLDFERFNAAQTGLYMNFLSFLDMAWYTTDPATIKSVEELEDSVIAERYLFPRLSGSESTHFDHLEDYAAGFYSYDLAAVMDRDVFDEFKQKGLYDKDLAKRLREIIYKNGSNVDPMELFVAMKGREPSAEALLKRDGLLPPDSNDAGKNPVTPKIVSLRPDNDNEPPARPSTNAQPKRSNDQPKP